MDTRKLTPNVRQRKEKDPWQLEAPSPDDRSLPKPRGKPDEQYHPDPDEVLKLEQTRIFGGLLPQNCRQYKPKHKKRRHFIGD
jgi:hypothetical protein